MKKIVVIGFAILIVVIAGFFLVRNTIGDLRPSLFPKLPSTSNQTPTSQINTSGNQSQTIGNPPDFNLSIPAGFQIGVFATDAPGARDLEFSEEGILLVSLTSEGKVVALPDKNNDGVADEVVTVLSGLNRPHGLSFYNGDLFVAQENKVVRYSWNENTLSVSNERQILSLPRGGRHFTRSIDFNESGQMFVSLGSTCDVCFEKEPWIGTLIVSNSEGENPRIYSKGLRNAVFVTVHPQSQKIWATEMGRDFLGDNAPPDEINILWDGEDFGWPICYGNNIHDTSFDKNVYIQDPCNDKITPVFEIPAHSAPLGLVFVESSQFGADFSGDLLVSYHGSWNRSTPIGYKIVRLIIEGEKVVGSEDFITGFLQGSEASGRPVDVIFDKSGSLYISDDKAGAVYKVIKSQ